jgi:hypothetical protein
MPHLRWLCPPLRVRENAHLANLLHRNTLQTIGFLRSGVEKIVAQWRFYRHIPAPPIIKGE